jgi:hypothetical protein
MQVTELTYAIMRHIETDSLFSATHNVWEPQSSHFSVRPSVHPGTWSRCQHPPQQVLWVRYNLSVQFDHPNSIDKPHNFRTNNCFNDIMSITGIATSLTINMNSKFSNLSSGNNSIKNIRCFLHDWPTVQQSFKLVKY